MHNNNNNNNKIIVILSRIENIIYYKIEESISLISHSKYTLNSVLLKHNMLKNRKNILIEFLIIEEISE